MRRMTKKEQAAVDRALARQRRYEEERSLPRYRGAVRDLMMAYAAKDEQWSMMLLRSHMRAGESVARFVAETERERYQ